MPTTPAPSRSMPETLAIRLGQLASGLARLGAWLGMLLIVYMLGHILLEIALRLFGSPPSCSTSSSATAWRP